MTMENEFAKRDWITQLWEETEHDKAARDFLFGAAIEDLEIGAEKIADDREDEIRDEVRGEIKEELLDDPPDELRATVIKGLIEDPPAGSDEALGPWQELEAQMRDRAREDVEGEMGDLRLEIETLKEENARLRGVESRQPRKARR